MQPVSVVRGRACPIDANDVDTDQIIPKQYLKRVERTGFGPFAFAEWRYLDDGSPNPDFAMNRPEHAGANVLVAGRNFGCGSSREHAPWALEDAGFQAIVAPSFADIFRTNCGKIGVCASQLDDEVVQQLFDLIAADPAVEVTVDLAGADGHRPGRRRPGRGRRRLRHRPAHPPLPAQRTGRHRLTLEHEDAITTYEASRPGWRPLVPTP
jgi:3-isopropylmalate/(R)-2-methylmalate dehydratase small subunit